MNEWMDLVHLSLIRFFFLPLFHPRFLPPLVVFSQNSELFTLTYGAIVRQVLHDYEDCVEEVNKKLDEMGHNIGCRLVEDFLAKTNTQRCGDFRDTAEVVAKVGLRMFLGIGASVTSWNAEVRALRTPPSNQTCVLNPRRSVHSLNAPHIPLLGGHREKPKK